MVRYPLNESMCGSLAAASGRKVDEITLEAVAAGEIEAADLAVQADTLRAQATVARDAGYVQLADNLDRAAELTAVPNDELLNMYETVRPRRATYDELMALADRLADEFDAQANAAFVREAADVYRKRDLLRRG